MKKKLLFIGVFIFSVFALVGCGKNSSKTLKCSLKQDVTSDVKIESNYNVEYTGDYVDRIKTVETVTSSSSEVLDAYNKQLDTIYSSFRKIDGYTNTIKKEDNRLISTTNIDYTKIDMKKLVEIDSSISSIIKDGKLKVSDIKSAYESLNATCK